MHLRNSCARSTSSCCQRHSACGRSSGGVKGSMRALTSVVPGDVADEVPDAREGAHRLDGDGLVLGEVREARLAHEAGPPVDLGAAGAALGGLAVPACREVGLGVSLDPVDGVEDDHALPCRHAVLVEAALLVGFAAEDPQDGLVHASALAAGDELRAARRLSSSVGVRRTTMASPSRAVATFTWSQLSREPTWSSRLCAPRLSVRSSAERAMASETMSMLRSSKTRS